MLSDVTQHREEYWPGVQKEPKLSRKTLGFPSTREGGEKTTSSTVGRARKAGGHLCFNPRPAVLVNFDSLQNGSQPLSAHPHNGAGVGASGSSPSSTAPWLGWNLSCVSDQLFRLEKPLDLFGRQFHLLQMGPIKGTALWGWGRLCMERAHFSLCLDGLRISEGE